MFGASRLLTPAHGKIFNNKQGNQATCPYPCLYVIFAFSTACILSKMLIEKLNLST